MLTRKNWSAFMRHEAGCAGRLIDSLWTKPEELIKSGEPLLGRDGVRATVRVRVDGLDYVVKRWKEQRWHHAAQQTILPSRAARCWRNAKLLLERHVVAPRPVAYREDRFGPLRGISYYAYRYVPGRTLQETIVDDMPDVLLRIDLAKQVLRIWHRLADMRLSLDDPSPHNFIVDCVGRLWAIDLDKMHHHRSRRGAVRGYRRSFDRCLEHGGHLFLHRPWDEPPKQRPLLPLFLSSRQTTASWHG